MTPPHPFDPHASLKTPLLSQSLAARGATGQAFTFAQVLGVAEAAYVIIGTLMMQNFVVYLISGNTQAEDIATAMMGDPTARLSWYPFYLVTLIVCVVRLPDIFKSLVSTWPIFLLLGLTAASLLWSVAPDITSRRVIALFFTVMFGVYLAVRAPATDTLRLIGIAALLVVGFHYLVILFQPEFGIDHDLHSGAWKGMLHEKNALGGAMAQSAVIFGALVQYDRRWRLLWTSALALCILLVLGSTSTTSLLALFLLGGLFALSRLARVSPAASAVTIYLACTAIAAGMIIYHFYAADILGLFGKDVTLTGRTDIWQAANQAIETRKWTGYGLGAFWYDPYGPSYIVRDQVAWEVPNAHSTWLEMGLATGWPGMFGLMALFGYALLRAFMRFFTRADAWPAIALSQMLVFSLSESTILWSQNLLSCVLFVFFAVIVLRPAEAQR